MCGTENELPMSKAYIVGTTSFVQDAVAIEAYEHEAMRVASTLNQKTSHPKHKRFNVYEALVHVRGIDAQD